jgi:zinc/manganese transport system ATP-binding protein
VHCSRGLLLQDARVILLDEPFASLDSKNGFPTFWNSCIGGMGEESAPWVAVLHDFELVSSAFFPEALLLARETGLPWGNTAAYAFARKILLKARRMSEAFDDQAGISAKTRPECCNVKCTICFIAPLLPKFDFMRPCACGC